jgi:hypothetical protein
MFFVGHISIAFVLSYLIVTKFRVPNISLSLVMFLSIFPDIDILFRFAGTDIAHRSITHSLIVFSVILCVLFMKYRRPSAAVYCIAYLSHIAIGDLIVGPLNLLYPFGIFYLSSGIEFKTSEHLLLEGLVLTVMAIIVIGRYLCNQKYRHTFPFEYSKKLDTIFYPIIILAVIVSPVFLLDESQKELPGFANSFFLIFRSFDDFDAIAILTLHSIALVIIIFLRIISRQSNYLQYPSQAKQKQNNQHKL